MRNFTSARVRSGSPSSCLSASATVAPSPSSISTSSFLVRAPTMTDPMSREMKRPCAPGRFEPCISGKTSRNAMRVPVYGWGSWVGTADSSSVHNSRRVQLCHVYIWRCAGGFGRDGSNSSSLGSLVHNRHNCTLCDRPVEGTLLEEEAQ
jgi:hypothetical protein